MSNRIMLAASCSMLIILSGCGTAGHTSSVPEPLSPQAGKSADQPVSEKRRPDGDLLSLNERQMVLFFKDLLQIDQKEGLGFTRAQAEAMLPLIRKSNAAGELAQTDQAQIVEMMTSEQKKYYDEMRSRPAHAGIVPPPHEHFSQEELERRIEEFERRRGSEREQEADPEALPSRSRMGAEGSPMPGGGKSVEQTLLELLESRLAP